MNFSKKAALTVAATMSLAIGGTVCAQTALAVDYPAKHFAVDSVDWKNALRQAEKKVDSLEGDQKKRNFDHDFFHELTGDEPLGKMSQDQLREAARQSVEKLRQGGTVTSDFAEGLQSGKVYVNPALSGFDPKKLRESIDTAHHITVTEENGTLHSPDAAGPQSIEEQAKKLFINMGDADLQEFLEMTHRDPDPNKYNGHQVGFHGNFIKEVSGLVDAIDRDDSDAIAKQSMAVVGSFLDIVAKHSPEPFSRSLAMVGAGILKIVMLALYGPPEHPSINGQVRDIRNSAWLKDASAAESKMQAEFKATVLPLLINSLSYDKYQTDALLDAQFKNTQNPTPATAKALDKDKKDLGHAATMAISKEADHAKQSVVPQIEAALNDKAHFSRYSDQFLDANKIALGRTIAPGQCSGLSYVPGDEDISQVRQNCLDTQAAKFVQNIESTKNDLRGDTPPHYGAENFKYSLNTPALDITLNDFPPTPTPAPAPADYLFVHDSKVGSTLTNVDIVFPDGMELAGGRTSDPVHLMGPNKNGVWDVHYESDNYVTITIAAKYTGGGSHLTMSNSIGSHTLPPDSVNGTKFRVCNDGTILFDFGDQKEYTLTHESGHGLSYGSPNDKNAAKLVRR